MPFLCVCQTLVVGIYDLIYEICIRDIFGYIDTETTER